MTESNRQHAIVSRAEWVEARRALLAEEKAFTRQRDALSQKRRELPWVRVDEPYTFTSVDGPRSLSDLFGGRSQLIVQHFMFGKDWGEGCPSCSFWADNFDGIDIHLAHRDISFVAVASASIDKLQAYRERMGWRFAFLSSEGTTFNRDYHVTFSAEELEAGGATYNFAPLSGSHQELPGVSAFYKDEGGAIFHTYSCYGRGLDALNGAYQYMDLAPKGRDEGELPWPMAWLKRHDQYDD